MKIALFLGASIFLAHCGPHDGGLSEYVCPPQGTDLTYETFGQAYLAGHCQVCHGQPPGKRNGAPSHVVFETHDDVREWADRIYARAAGPNTSMPPGPDDPPRAERDMLAEWLGCGAP